ncbi:hypothetical protein C5167_050101 [Papaver somniferum]|uniref:Uncharacterized protein n=1 Tax=Papaver somniferum TaxID=3469 RepID=A0A4Y7KQK6_PAPSO|nr:uncharacterized protein LOC113302765 [Papaver somniferum]RZC74620.1 hypothetical protein C5167_050101 [Papaver somniferum]
MPPSPVLRRSPKKDLRVTTHKRGRSLEGGIIVKQKDDDLLLFNEMEHKESDNILLQSTDEFDVSLSRRLDSISSFKLGVSVPSRGESSDLLNADEEKNDYDWLLTPPDTPLFRSLDDETIPVNLVQRGRTRSQPISVSRASTAEKSYRGSRTSASPQRLSPSPRSGNSTLQSRGRPSSARNSSPSPSVRPSSPSLRPSTPPIKNSTPSQRSSTPTSRKINVGSSGNASSSGRGTSPVNTSRGSSPSPKFSAWQSSIPGFPSEAPPNLRTSLADTPASYVRGSSPASRSGRDSSKLGRQSMSPTASRSANSAYSYERDRHSTQSKGSFGSSGDDDVDSLYSTNLSVSERSVSKKVGSLPNGKVVFSNKSSGTSASSSAPKRSFDSALRQMERKSPQMFRPLLSSVPSTTFYAGNANSSFRPMASRNSSLTTSSNASSEHGASVALDTECSEHDKDNLPIESKKVPFNDDQNDEVFKFDRVDEVDEDGAEQDVIRDSIGGINSKEQSISAAAKDITTTSPESFIVEFDQSKDAHLRTPATCSQCGRKFDAVESMDKHINICPVCHEKVACISVHIPDIEAVFTDAASHSQMTLKEKRDDFEADTKAGILKRAEMEPVQVRMNFEQGESLMKNSSLEKVRVGGGVKDDPEQQVVIHPTLDSSPHKDTAGEEFKNSYPNKTIDAEAAGISLLLRRSSSSKWHVVQGRSFTATNVPCNNPSYARDSQSSMRNSSGHGSASASSSGDWSSSKHTDIRVQRQSSSRMYDMENSNQYVDIDVLRRWSSFSVSSNHANKDTVQTKSTQEGNFSASIEREDYTGLTESHVVSEEHRITSKGTELDYRDPSLANHAVFEENKLAHTESDRMIDGSTSDILSPTMSIQLEELRALASNEDCVSSDNYEDLSNNVRNNADAETSVMTEETATTGKAVRGTDMTGAESTALENDDANAQDSHSDSGESRNSESTIDEQETSVSLDPAPETSLSNQVHVIVEESNVVVENRHMRRSLTLEEATDTILFCSSIIHDLAYEAATVALSKEINEVHLEGSVPTITIPDKSCSERKDQRGKTTVRKRPPKSEKARQRRVETEENKNSNTSETDITSNDSLKHDSGLPKKVDTSRPPKLESKCNCTIM